MTAGLLGGRWGNKGGVGISVNLDGTTLLFVNAHLAAFDEMIDRRNADFHDISRRLLFGPCEEYVDSPTVNIFQSDIIIWMVSTVSTFRVWGVYITNALGRPVLILFLYIWTS